MTEREKLELVKAHEGRFKYIPDGDVWYYKQITEHQWEYGFENSGHKGRTGSLDVIYNQVSFVLDNQNSYIYVYETPVNNDAHFLIDWINNP